MEKNPNQQGAPEWEEPALIVFIRSSEEDVAALAQAYLDDEVIAGVLRTLGTYGLPTDAQRRLVDAFTLNNPRIPWSGRDPLLADIAQALARRIATGEIATVASPVAKEFIADKFMDRTDSRAQLKPIRSDSFYATAAELVDAAKFLFAQDRYRTIFFAPLGRDKADDDIRYMEKIRADYVASQGLHCRGMGVSGAIIILEALRSGQLRSLDSTEASEFVKSNPITFSRETR